MATRQRLKLSDVVVRQAKCAEGKATTVLPDGDGLRLLVYSNGIKVWQYRDYTAGKNTTIQLGRYPTMPLSEARKAAAAIHDSIKQGSDPVTERRIEKAKRRISSETTFKAIAEELLDVKAKNVTPTYLRKMRSAFAGNLYPRIGMLPIQEVDAPTLREALRHVEARGALDMLSFVRRRTAEVFDYAKATARFKGDNPAHALAKNIFEQHKSEHMPALKWEEMPGFLHRLDGMKGEFATIAGVRLLMLTGCRPGEVRGARWEEFDLDNAKWTIPAARMKRRTPHIVPLAHQTVALIKELHQLTGHSDYLFPAAGRGAKSPTLTDMALLKAIKRHAGHSNVTAHGFRATFRTHAEESGLWPFEVMEAALAHGKKNPVVGAYARATHYDARAKLAQWYADELDSVKKGNIVPLRKAEAA